MNLSQKVMPKKNLEMFISQWDVFFKPIYLNNLLGRIKPAVRNKNLGRSHGLNLELLASLRRNKFLFTMLTGRWAYKRVNWSRRAAYLKDSRSQPLSYEGVTGTENEKKMKKQKLRSMCFHLHTSLARCRNSINFARCLALVPNQRKQHSKRASSYHA